MDSNKKRKLGNAIMLTLIPLAVTIWLLNERRLDINFRKVEIRSMVMSSSDWQKSSVDFYMRDGTEINFSAPVGNKMIVGDSVYKPSNTSVFNVYRKGYYDTVYTFIRSYDNEEFK